MSAIVLIDTSIWTRALRRGGDPTARERVRALMGAGDAVWCDPIRLELWAGVRADERAELRRLESFVPRLPITDAVWSRACQLADAARDRGLTIPSNDLLVFACGRTFGVTVEHADKHFHALDHLDPR